LDISAIGRVIDGNVVVAAVLVPKCAKIARLPLVKMSAGESVQAVFCVGVRIPAHGRVLQAGKDQGVPGLGRHLAVVQTVVPGQGLQVEPEDVVSDDLRRVP